jgi:inner membrane protein
MSPVTHFLAGWLVTGGTSLRRREKALIVSAGLAPDLDGLGAVPELLTRNSSHPLAWFSLYHHSLHTLAFALICATMAWLFAAAANFAFGPKIVGRPLPTHPWTTAFLAFLSFHLHLLGDLVGSRGPDGDQWPLPYLAPFSNSGHLSWHGQWALNAWPNFVIAALLLAATLWLASNYGSSPLELVSEKANRSFVASLRRRTGSFKRSGRLDPSA